MGNNFGHLVLIKKTQVQFVGDVVALRGWLLSPEVRLLDALASRLVATP